MSIVINVMAKLLNCNDSADIDNFVFLTVNHADNCFFFQYIFIVVFISNPWRSVIIIVVCVVRVSRKASYIV